jgi:hypothetical protein
LLKLARLVITGILKPLKQLYRLNRVQAAPDKVKESAPTPEVMESRTSDLGLFS